MTRVKNSYKVSLLLLFPYLAQASTSPCANGFLKVLQYGAIELDCSNVNINGPIPTELGMITELKYLKLRNANITGTIPTEFGDLVNLIDIDLSENQLSGTIPSELQSLKAAHTMDLSMNRLSCGIPSELSTLPSLKELRLNHNALSGTIPPSLLDRTNGLGGDHLLLLAHENRIATGEEWFVPAWEPCQLGNSRRCTAGDDQCRDGLCHPSAACPALPRNSTEAPTPSRVPAGWTCDASFYGGRDGCDCGLCGEARDPDCEDADQLLVGCRQVALGCGPRGECLYPPVPPEWTCDVWRYAAGDGCDCRCGALDPDCEARDRAVIGCEAEEEAVRKVLGANSTARVVCEGAGECAIVTASPTTAPSAHPTHAPSWGMEGAQELVFPEARYREGVHDMGTFQDFLAQVVVMVTGATADQVRVVPGGRGSQEEVVALVLVRQTDGEIRVLSEGEMAEIVLVAIALDARRGVTEKYHLSRSMEEGSLVPVLGGLLGAVLVLGMLAVAVQVRKWHNQDLVGDDELVTSFRGISSTSKTGVVQDSSIPEDEELGLSRMESRDQGTEAPTNENGDN